MKYSIEIGKIVEGALKHDQTKVINYTKQLIAKLEQDNEERAANKFSKLLSAQSEATLSAMGMKRILLFLLILNQEQYWRMLFILVKTILM